LISLFSSELQTRNASEHFSVTVITFPPKKRTYLDTGGVTQR
jgi:hypothetical protein